jgi:hypothetical protein
MQRLVQLRHPLTYVGTRFLLQRTLCALLHSFEVAREKQHIQKADHEYGEVNRRNETNRWDWPENEQHG